jgi:hypothetical protein
MRNLVTDYKTTPVRFQFHFGAPAATSVHWLGECIAAVKANIVGISPSDLIPIPTGAVTYLLVTFSVLKSSDFTPKPKPKENQHDF